VRGVEPGDFAHTDECVELAHLLVEPVEQLFEVVALLYVFQRDAQRLHDFLHEHRVELGAIVDPVLEVLVVEEPAVFGRLTCYHQVVPDVRELFVPNRQEFVLVHRHQLVEAVCVVEILFPALVLHRHDFCANDVVVEGQHLVE